MSFIDGSRPVMVSVNDVGASNPVVSQLSGDEAGILLGRYEPAS
jgi:hypothetical protein